MKEQIKEKDDHCSLVVETSEETRRDLKKPKEVHLVSRSSGEERQQLLSQPASGVVCKKASEQKRAGVAAGRINC